MLAIIGAANCHFASLLHEERVISLTLRQRRYSAQKEPSKHRVAFPWRAWGATRRSHPV